MRHEGGVVTIRRLLAVAFIFAATAVGWFALGSSVLYRTESSTRELSHDVGQLWGGRHAQEAPRVWYERSSAVIREVEETDAAGATVRREVEELILEKVPVPLTSSAVEVQLDLEHRRKGLLWHDTYTVDFSGRYAARLPANAPGPLEIHFAFPSPQAIYDDFSFVVDGTDVATLADLSTGAAARAAVAPGEEVVFAVAYRSRGMGDWRYLFTAAGIAPVRAFSLELTTDFDEVDFLPATLAPTAKSRAGDGWRLDWEFASLISGQSIGVDLPNKLNPGPLTARIIFFAPVALLFFITVLVILTALGHLELHPVHYFFLAAAFFSFHLLLAYLVDHVSIHLAFVAAAAVSIALVVSYLRLVCGLGRAIRYAGAAQLVFLVLFSYAFFFEGFTGLAVTLGSILTLFVLMQVTGRVAWDAVFATDRPAAPSGLAPDSSPASAT